MAVELQRAGGRRILLSSNSGQASIERAVKLGVRAEHTDVSLSQGLRFCVEPNEPVGGDVRNHRQLSEGHQLCVAPDQRPKVRTDTIRILPRAQYLHLFDSESGERL